VNQQNLFAIMKFCYIGVVVRSSEKFGSVIRRFIKDVYFMYVLIT